MEQKKTLWIIAAAGAFLLVVLGAAGIIYSPVKNPTPTIASVSPVDKKASNVNTGWINPPADSTNTDNLIPTTTTSDLVVLADNATVYEMPKTTTSPSSGTTIDLNSLKNEILSETQAQVQASQPQNINITVNVPETKTAVVEKPVEIKETKEVKTEAKVAAASESKPAAKTETKTTKTNTVTKTVNNTTVTATAKSEAKKTQFWVQVAAYCNKKGAEGARSVLDSNKIPADIFTFKDNKDRLFYRVRVGPYTTKSEAEYWRTRIIKIDEFSKAESYITSTTN